MKKKNTYIFLILIIFLTSCNDWLDINNDPNNPDAISPELALPAAELSLVSQVNSFYNIAGGIMSQYWAQSNSSIQYIEFDSYNISASTLDLSFQEMYSGALNDFEYIKKEALKNEDQRYYIIATALQCYGFQLLADLYDKIPFNQALQGQQYLQPAYNNGNEVYDSLIVRLDNVHKLTTNIINDPASLSKYETALESDYIFKGDLYKWERFINTLRLKIYIRQCLVNNTKSNSGIISMINASALFLDEDASIKIFNSEPNRLNPLYAIDQFALNIKNNLLASHTFISWLKLHNDPRITKLYIAGKSGQVGVPQGTYNTSTTVQNPENFSRARILATDHAFLISKAEANFLLAEAALRYGFSDPKIYYENGVKAAFERFGFNANNYLTGVYAYPDSGNFEDKLKAIITQKWASNAGINGIESYIEHVRTGYPERTELLTTDTQYKPGTFVKPKTSVLSDIAGKHQYPKRFVYPKSERTRNSNTPIEVSNTTPVWWNINK